MGRGIFGFILAVLTATSLVAVITPFPLTLFPPITLIAILAGAMIGGPAAAVALAAAFAIARRLSPSRTALVLAGGLAGLIFALGCLAASLWVKYWAHFGYRPWQVFAMLGEHPSLGRFLLLGLGSVVGGVAAGWVFAKVGRLGTEPDAEPSSLMVPGLLVLSLAVLGGAWFGLHDPGGDVLCAHGDSVRITVGKSAYVIPARYQPDLVSMTDGPADPVHVFDAGRWQGSFAAAQTDQRLTYCQTTADEFWPVQSFMVSFLWSHQSLPAGVSSLKVVRAFDFRYFRPQQLHLSAKGADLWFLPTDGLVRYSDYGKGGYGPVYVQMPDGAWLEVSGMYKPTPDSIAAMLRKAGPFLAGLKRP